MSAGNAVQRLFIALPCPLTLPIAAALEELRTAQDAGQAGLRGVNPATLHITLKFLGGVPAERLAYIKAALDALRTAPAMTLTLEGAGSFHAALWLGVAPNPALPHLAHRCDTAMEALGFAPEQRPFRPHITVARLAPTAAFDSRAWVRRQRGTRWGELHADTVHLYRSEARPGGALYSVIHSVHLQGALSGS